MTFLSSQRERRIILSCHLTRPHGAPAASSLHDTQKTQMALKVSRKHSCCLCSCRFVQELDLDIRTTGAALMFIVFTSLFFTDFHFTTFSTYCIKCTVFINGSCLQWPLAGSRAYGSAGRSKPRRASYLE